MIDKGMGSYIFDADIKNIIQQIKENKQAIQSLIDRENKSQMRKSRKLFIQIENETRENGYN